MSCDNSTTSVKVLDLDGPRGRHRRDEDGRDFDSLRDLLMARENGEAHRDIVEKILEVGQANLKETLEAKFVGVRETVEAKGAVLAALAEARADAKEAKHDLAVKILEGQIAAEKAQREQQAFLFQILCKPRTRGGCGDHD